MNAHNFSNRKTPAEKATQTYSASKQTTCGESIYFVLCGIGWVARVPFDSNRRNQTSQKKLNKFSRRMRGRGRNKPSKLCQIKWILFTNSLSFSSFSDLLRTLHDNLKQTNRKRFKSLFDGVSLSKDRMNYTIQTTSELHDKCCYLQRIVQWNC